MTRRLAIGLFLLASSAPGLASGLWFGAGVRFSLGSLLLSLTLLWLGSRRPSGRLAWFSLAALVAIVMLFNLALAECYYLTGASFAESFFYHARPDLFFAGLGEHWLPIGLALTLLTAATAAYLVAVRRPAGPGRRPLAAPLLALAVALALWQPAAALAVYLGEALVYSRPNGLAARVAPGAVRHAAADLPARASLAEQDSVRLDGAKNLVVIYAESMERAYLDSPAFRALTPGLRALRAEAVDFTQVGPGFASDWTVAGLVATQCGLPLINGPLINPILGRPMPSVRQAILPNAVCLGDILAANGYHVAYIGGADARFAGKERFLTHHGFNDVLGSVEIVAELSRAPLSEGQPAVGPWGYYDETTVAFFERRFGELAAQGRPFALFFLTLDTHHPNGTPSPSCNSAEPDAMRRAIGCTDALVARAVAGIRHGPHGEETVVVVLSDHLAHRTSQSPLLPRHDQRLNSFFVLDHGRAAAAVTSEGTVFDVPATLIDLLGGGRHIVGAGSSLLAGDGFLAKNRLRSQQKAYFLGPAMSDRLSRLWGER